MIKARINPLFLRKDRLKLSAIKVEIWVKTRFIFYGGVRDGCCEVAGVCRMKLSLNLAKAQVRLVLYFTGEAMSSDELLCLRLIDWAHRTWVLVTFRTNLVRPIH